MKNMMITILLSLSVGIQASQQRRPVTMVDIICLGDDSDLSRLSNRLRSFAPEVIDTTFILLYKRACDDADFRPKFTAFILEKFPELKNNFVNFEIK